MWAFSGNYPVFFMPVFSVKKGTFFVSLQQLGLLCTAVYVGIAIWKDNPVWVATRVGYYAFFLQQIARPRNARM